MPAGLMTGGCCDDAGTVLRSRTPQEGPDGRTYLLKMFLKPQMSRRNVSLFISQHDAAHLGERFKAVHKFRNGLVPF